MEDLNKLNSDSIQVVSINDRQNARYYASCQLQINGIDGYLVIKPTENKNDFIHATFARNYIHQNLFPQILYIDECKTDSNKYAIIFSSVQRCEKFINNAKNGKFKHKFDISQSENGKIFKTKFLIPFLHYCQENPTFEDQIETTLLELLEVYKNVEESIDDSQESDNNVSTPAAGDNEHDKDIPAVANPPLVEPVEDAENTVPISSAEAFDVDRDENNEMDRNLRKRRRVTFKLDTVDENSLNQSTNIERETKKQKLSPTAENIIQAPNFKYIHYIRNGGPRYRLFIFPNPNQNSCYEYFYDFHRKVFSCCGCISKKKHTSAEILQDSTGKDYVYCLKTNHICELRPFNSDNYQSDLIIKKPNFEEATEDCIYSKNEKKKKILMIFTSKDKKNYFKFTWDNGQNMYNCRKCRKESIYIQAYVSEDENGNEFVYVRNLKHACSNMEYVECHQTMENESSTFKQPQQQWIKRSKPVKESANLEIDLPQNFQELNPPVESKIIRKPNYKLVERKSGKKILKKLVIFLPNDKKKKQCYEYTWSSTFKYYTCNSCKGVHVSAKVVQNGTDEEYVQLNTTEHKCKPKK